MLGFLDFLSALTIAASCIEDDGHDADDLADAVEAVAFWWDTEMGEPLRTYDGRVLVRLSGEDNTFTCAGCQRCVPWSDGAADDMPEHCTACWNAAHAPTARAS